MCDVALLIRHKGLEPIGGVNDAVFPLCFKLFCIALSGTFRSHPIVSSTLIICMSFLDNCFSFLVTAFVKCSLYMLLFPIRISELGI